MTFSRLQVHPVWPLLHNSATSAPHSCVAKDLSKADLICHSCTCRDSGSGAVLCAAEPADPA